MSKYLTAALIAYAAFVTPVLADDWAGGPWSYQGESPKAYVDPNPTVDQQIAENKAHEFETYSRIRDNGGCNADFVTTEIATFCNKGIFGGPQMGSND